MGAVTFVSLVVSVVNGQTAFAVQGSPPVTSVLIAPHAQLTVLRPVRTPQGPMVRVETDGTVVEAARMRIRYSNGREELFVADESGMSTESFGTRSQLTWGGKIELRGSLPPQTDRTGRGSRYDIYHGQ